MLSSEKYKLLPDTLPVLKYSWTLRGRETHIYITGGPRGKEEVV